MACAPRYMTPVSPEDMERGDGDTVVQFQEQFCRVTKDGFAGRAGELIRFRPWQKTLTSAIYARRPDNRRKHRRALIGLPRKNGKSAINSGFALHALVTGGTGAEVYCLDPNTRVLCIDLQWRSCGSLSHGDEIIGFDEYPSPGVVRRFRPAQVTSAHRITQPAYEVHLSDGRKIVASALHQWVCRPYISSNLQRWETTENLKPGSRIHDLGAPWEFDQSREAGYLAGLLDGEACLVGAGSNGGTYRRGAVLSFAQNPGDVLDRFDSGMKARGFDLKANNHNKCFQRNIRGTRDVLRALGSLGPSRLLAKVPYWIDGIATNRLSWTEVVAVEYLGEQEVVAIGTTTKTLIAEGLFSHNSCAADKDQAKIVFGVTKRMVEMDEGLSQLLKCYRDVIEFTDTGSIYKALSSEAYSKEGLNPTFVVYDELHAAPNDELYDVMLNAFGARRDPMLLAISTAGTKSDQTGGDSICYKLFQMGEKICKGELEDDSFFFAWWGAEDDADASSPAVWEGCNPSYADLIDPEDFSSVYTQHLAKGTVNDFKALDIATPILTANGWSLMRDIQPGDSVFAGDGSRTSVVGVSDVFTDRKCYEVSFEDGRSVVADEYHEWHVVDSTHSNQRIRKTVTTRELMSFTARARYVEPCNPVDLLDVDLPVDPYILGYWLGDGSSNDPTITAHANDVISLLEQCEAVGYKTSVWHTPTAEKVYVKGIRGKLVSIGVLNNKHIPEEYLIASTSQRLSLLQGLLDSDGTVTGVGSIRFVNTNQNLVDGVLFLARSLGCIARVHVINTGHAKTWRVAWTMPNDLPPFRLARKLEKIVVSDGHLRASASRLIDVTEVASRPTKCLAVDHPSHTFLAGKDLVRTGNTKRMNMWVNATQAWMPDGAWGKCRREFQFVPPPKGVVLGFDGSLNGDSTGLIAVTVEPDPKLKVLGCWEKPTDKSQAVDWKVPREEVKEAIREACRTYNVREVAADEYIWVSELEELAEEGIPVVTFPQTMTRMQPATQRFYELVTTQRISHDGNPTLARHLNNARLKTDIRGSRLQKDTRNSPRKIDLAVASVMAVDRAGFWLTQDSPGTWNGVPVKSIKFVWSIIWVLCIAGLLQKTGHLFQLDVNGVVAVAKCCLLGSSL